MGRRGGLISAAAVACCLGLALVAAPAAQGASTGAITGAVPSPDWSSVAVDGWVEWGGCEQPAPPEEPPLPGPEGGGEGTPAPPGGSSTYYCGWTPYATLGPGADTEECSQASMRPMAFGGGAVPIWEGGASTAAGRVTFGVDPALAGGSPYLLCLGLVEEGPAPIGCAAALVSGCTVYGTADFFHQLDAVVLSKPPTEQGGEPSGQGSSGSQGHRRCRRSRCHHRHRRHHHRRGRCHGHKRGASKRAGRCKRRHGRGHRQVGTKK